MRMSQIGEPEEEIVVHPIEIPEAYPAAPIPAPVEPAPLAPVPA